MDDDSDDDVYEVEKIVDNVLVGGETYYRVRWKNYSVDGDTWEPRENLLSCEDLLNNYIRVQSEKASGLNLPSDVFTAGTASSKKDSSSECAVEEPKSSKVDKRKLRRPPQERKVQRGRGRKPKPTVSSSESTSEEEPQVKDPFWENLEQGKIDVFASDLYSKVKQRRFPEPEPQPDVPVKIRKKPGPKKKSEMKKDAEQPKTEKMQGKVEEKTKRITRQSEAEEAAKEKAITAPSSVEESPPKEQEKNAVLQYLEKEIQSKKEKRGRKMKTREEKLKKAESKQSQDEANNERKSFIHLFEESEGNLPAIQEEPHDAESNEVDDVKTSTDVSKTISKPNIVLEKIDLPSKEKEGTDSTGKQKEKGAKESRKVEDSQKKPQKGKEETETTLPKEEKEKPEDTKINRRITRKETKSTEKTENKLADDKSPGEESKKSEKKSKVNKEQSKEKSINQLEATDAFSAQLQESDLAATDLLLKKKTKKLKPGPKASPATERSPLSSVLTSESSSGTSVLELLTQEMERTVSMGSSTLDPKVTPFDAAVKDAHNKLGLKSPSPSISTTERPQPVSCVADMVEFLKIKVNFELDEISVKDIERHHEMGEPPCRLERDVTNAEFRQYIRSNNFEMVHEALKSKKMMYNLEHTDSVWMTQLMVAAAAGFDEIVKVLAHHGARVNARSKIGQTALMFAAEKGHDIVCRILIAYGAYINLQTTSGETALMKAAKNGHSTIVRYLLQAGADPTLKSAHGTTAREMAERAAQPSLSDVIRFHETNINAYVNECLHRECHILGLKTIGLPILGTRVFNIRENPLVHVTFNCVLQSLPPNQGVLLFVLHGMIGSGLSIKCRMRGPCYVNAVTLNNFVMDAVMPGKQANEPDNHFITNLIWRNGQNSLRLFLSQDALSNEKLFMSIFVCGFAD